MTLGKRLAKRLNGGNGNGHRRGAKKKFTAQMVYELYDTNRHKTREIAAKELGCCPATIGKRLAELRKDNLKGDGNIDGEYFLISIPGKGTTKVNRRSASNDEIAEDIIKMFNWSVGIEKSIAINLGQSKIPFQLAVKKLNKKISPEEKRAMARFMGFIMREFLEDEQLMEMENIKLLE